MHQKKNVGAVELATMSFGQSIQITPLQLLRAVSAVINGGKLITPHFGRYVQKQDGTRLKAFLFSERRCHKKQTSDTMKELLEAVVSDGSGRNCRMDGFSIGERRQPVRNFQEEMENIFLLFRICESRQSCDHWDRVDR